MGRAASILGASGRGRSHVAAGSQTAEARAVLLGPHAGGVPSMITPGHLGLNRDQPLLHRKQDQVGVTLKVESSHDVMLVKFHSLIT